MSGASRAADVSPRVSHFSLDLGDIEFKPGGLLLTIRRSKTDQEQHGQVVAVAHGCHVVTDPVAALAAWLRIRGRQPGTLFSRIFASRVSDQPLGNHVVARRSETAP